MAIRWSIWTSDMEARYRLSECVSGIRVHRRVDNALVGVYSDLAAASDAVAHGRIRPRPERRIPRRFVSA